jgi:hypothetical protein
MITEERHPHPHKDPRRPHDQAQLRTNPPVFTWKPYGVGPFGLLVARDAQCTDIALEQNDLADPLYLPEHALAPGRYFWKWRNSEDESSVFTFEIPPDAVMLEVPPPAEWLRRIGEQRPRMFIRPEEIAALRASRTGYRATLWQALRAKADRLLDQSHEMDEPPFLPDRQIDYQAYHAAWSPVMWNSRRFMKGAATLALAYLASGDERYGRAACRRIASVSRWNPEGSSHITHNDEAHMSIIWHGTHASDWVWELFTAEERALVVEQFRRRGQITYDHIHSNGAYGITRFDSHSGREIVFLAQIALALHDHIPEAQTWLEWLRPVLCGIWPIWSVDDGAWAEGPNYATTYVTIMTTFATTLKRSVGVDLYRRPFWRNHALWRQYCVPFYAEWIGFSDCDVRGAGRWNAYADLVETIERETEAPTFGRYVADLRATATTLTESEDESVDVSAQRYLFMKPEPLPETPESDSMFAAFPETGYAAIRTHLNEPQRDIAFIFRSSPFGSISHSHANNNDFIIHVAGNILAMPSGYYDGFGSNHHTNWVWHTKAHNCVTLSDAPQLMRSHDSRGAIERVFEDERLIYFCGIADSSYSDRASRCRRHVVFLKAQQCFALIDEFVAAPGVVSTLQWNLHSWAPFDVDATSRSFTLERAGSRLHAQFMYHQNAFFSLSEGWDPPPAGVKSKDRWFQQYNLRFTLSGIESRRNLGVILAPAHAALQPPDVRAERVGDVEVAHIGSDSVFVRQKDAIALDDLRSDALAVLIVQGQRYDVSDVGIDTLKG